MQTPCTSLVPEQCEQCILKFQRNLVRSRQRRPQLRQGQRLRRPLEHFPNHRRQVRMQLGLWFGFSHRLPHRLSGSSTSGGVA